MGPIGSPETSVTHNQSTLCNITEEQRSHIHHSGSVKSQVGQVFLYFVSTTKLT